MEARFFLYLSSGASSSPVSLSSSPKITLNLTFTGRSSQIGFPFSSLFTKGITSLAGASVTGASLGASVGVTGATVGDTGATVGDTGASVGVTGATVGDTG